jgi:hypothetical protein
MPHLKVICSKTIKCFSTFSFRTKFATFPISPSMAARPAYLNLLHLVRLSTIRTDQYKHCSSSTSNNLLGPHILRERLNFIPTWNMQNCIVGFNLNLYLCVCVLKKKKKEKILRFCTAYLTPDNTVASLCTTWFWSDNGNISKTSQWCFAPDLTLTKLTNKKFRKVFWPSKG